MSFQTHLGDCKAILTCMLDKAPRDGAGDYVKPFSVWIRKLREDIRKAEEWEKSTAEQTRDKEDGAE